MTSLDIAQRRLHNQYIAGTPLAGPSAVVGWLGAVQAQDYAAAKWALGLRLHGVTDAAIEQACAAGAILRTHVLRPTWHFVTPADIRWLLALTAPRVHTANASMYRRLELNAATFAASETALTQALAGGQALTRPELQAVLRQAGLVTGAGLRFLYMLMHAELDGLICSGPQRGKEITFVLLNERVPASRTWERDEALAELTRRYFTSHGPATVPDFVWWSGLTVADARAGLAMVTAHLQQEVIGDQTYWSSPQTPPTTDISQTVYLLPNYDEYVVGYTDRSAAFDAQLAEKVPHWSNNVLFTHTIVSAGRIVGTWKRTLKKGAVVVEATPFGPLNAAETRALAAAAARYEAFLDLPVLTPNPNPSS